MIVNITKGKSARGGLEYDYGPGKKEEHKNPRRVAGNVAGRTHRQRASRFDRVQRNYIQQTGRKPKQPVVRMAVAASPEDATMTDRQWGQIAHQTVDKFTGGKADQYPWEAVRHDDGHIHITLSRCGTDGKLLSSSNDYRRAQAIGRDIEQRYGLTETKNRTLGKSASKAAGRRPAEDRTDRSDADRSNVHTTLGTELSGVRDRYQELDQRQGDYEQMDTTDRRTFREKEHPYELLGSESLEKERAVKEAASAEMAASAQERVQGNEQARQAGQGGDRDERQRARAARETDRGARQGGQSKSLDRDSRARIYSETKPGSPERRQAIQESRREQQGSAKQADNTKDRQQEQQQQRNRERGRER